MPEETIECPKCGCQIPLTKALTGPIEARLRTVIEADATRKGAELEKREKKLREREGKLADQVEAEVKARESELTRKVKKEVEAEHSRKMGALEDDLKLASERAVRAEDAERELRKSRQQVLDREKALDLEVGRKVEEGTKAAEEKVRRELSEEEQLKQQERQLREDGLKRQIADLQQKVAQGSQQTQGEALEVAIEEELRRTFPGDTIEPVPSGTRGADILQKVATPSGQRCGTIVWETKRTKEWSTGWIAKLREDQGRLGADAAILVSRALPEGVRNFSFEKGVVISSFACSLPVATLVRLRLLEVARQKKVDETSTETREELYQYLTSRDFISRVENIVTPLVEMRSDLESEVRAFETRWRKRRREIERAERSIAGVYGDLQGIVGKSSLPEVPRLSLPAADDQTEGAPVDTAHREPDDRAV